MIDEFLRGAQYAISGCRYFYGDRKTWKYAAIPLLIMSVLYLLAFRAVLWLSGKAAETVNAWLSGLPGWLSWVHSLVSGFSCLLGITAALLMLGITVCTLYEIFGGLFFDSLVEYFEQKKYGFPPRKWTVGALLKFALDSVLFGLRSSILFVILFIISLFFPVIGQILLIAVMGYYTGIAYLTGPAGNHRLSIAGMRRLAGSRKTLLLGFGVTAYLLLTIPFATLFLLPCLVLGGAELFNRELRKDL